MANKNLPLKEKYIETPEKMWELFCSYKEWIKDNPFKINDWVGGVGKKVIRTKERPLTMEGFEGYVFEQKLNGELSHYFSNKDSRYSNYVAICSRIRKAIRAEQIEGGMAGTYNPSITQRLNNLVEKQAVDTTIKVTLDGTDNIST